jgi:hypothetical protein
MSVEHEINLENLKSLVQERQSLYDYKNKIYFLPVQFLLKEKIKQEWQHPPRQVMTTGFTLI